MRKRLSGRPVSGASLRFRFAKTKGGKGNVEGLSWMWRFGFVCGREKGKGGEEDENRGRLVRVAGFWVKKIKPRSSSGRPKMKTRGGRLVSRKKFFRVRFSVFFFL